MRAIWSALILLLCVLGTAAQSIRYQIEVRDMENDEALIGAHADYEGGQAISDEDGRIYIQSDQDPLTIVISYIGYEPKSIKVDRVTASQIVYLDSSNNILETMTITASRYEQRLSASTVSIEVLPTQLIGSTNANSAEDVLDKVPGVQMIDGQANIRGGSGYSYGAGSRVLLLLDDLPALQVDAGFPNWNDLPIEATEQIEILKGAASTLYGSAALNGIINLRRIKPGVKPRTEVSLSATRYADPSEEKKKWYSADERPNGQQVTAMHARKIGAADIMMHGLYRKLDSYNQDTYEDRYRLGFTSSYRHADQWLFGLSTVYNATDNSSFFFWNDPTSGIYTPFTNSTSRSNSSRYHIDPSIKFFADNGDTHTLRSRVSRVNNNNNNNQSNSSTALFTEYQYQTAIGDKSNLVTGVSYMTSDSDSELFGDTIFTASNAAAYAQIDHEIGNRMGITLGGRYEYNKHTSPTSFNGVIVPDGKVDDDQFILRVGVNYQLADYTFLRGSYGQGYRFPTITERFITTTFSGLEILPNPGLRPEKGWTTELGVKQGLKIGDVEGFLDFSLFYQKYEDMTEFVLVSSGALGFQSLNVGGTEIRGLEISYTGRAHIGPVPIFVFGGYTYIDPKYQDFTEHIAISSSSEDNVLKYRTRHNAKVDISAEYKGAAIGIAYNRTSHMLAIDSAFEILGSPQIKAYRDMNDNGYHLINARASYQWKAYKLSCIVDNITNTEYTQRPGLLEATRNYTLRFDYLIDRD